MRIIVHLIALLFATIFIVILWITNAILQIFGTLCFNAYLWIVGFISQWVYRKTGYIEHWYMKGLIWLGTFFMVPYQFITKLPLKGSLFLLSLTSRINTLLNPSVR